MQPNAGQEQRGRTWAREWTQAIGDSIRLFRGRNRMSAAQLAEATAAVGYPISRNTITAIETGRKETLSVQELAVLAFALDVAPVQLLFPIGRSNEPVAVTPTAEMGPLDACNWIGGNPELITDRACPSPRYVANSNVMLFLRGHAQGAARWQRVRRQLNGDADLGGYAKVLRVELDEAAQQIRANRDMLRQLGAEPPALPQGLDMDGAER